MIEEIKVGQTVAIGGFEGEYQVVGRSEYPMICTDPEGNSHDAHALHIMRSDVDGEWEVLSASERDATVIGQTK